MLSEAEYTPPIIREQVPRDVESILDDIRYYSPDPQDVDDSNAGLRVQWQAGLIEKNELERILEKRKRLKGMIDQGVIRV